VGPRDFSTGVDMVDERRTRKRFQVKDWIFSVLVPRYDRLGKIIDISEGGLSFHYIARSSTEDPQKMHKSFAIEVFEGGGGRSLVRLPCTTVYDRETGDSISGDPAMIRRCGVQFDKLSSSQKSQLASFLHHYTTGEVVNRGSVL
jgi:hypothetical protein